MSKTKPQSSSIILDLSIKNALEQRAQLNPKHEVILPWWFKRYTHIEYSSNQQEAYVYIMRWLQENAPEEAENIYDEADMSQNIIINPMFLIKDDILQAFSDAGFRVMEEKDLPSQEKTDIYDRLKHGSNFSDKWH